MHLRTMLSVRNLKSSIRFYRSALGFELVEALGGTEKLYWAYVKKVLFTLRDPDGYTLSFGILISPDLWPR